MYKSSIEFRQLEQKYNIKVKLRLTTSAQIAAILMLAAGLLVGCQCNQKPNTESIKENIVYFKDTTTNLCFAAVNSTNTKSLSNTSSIACVPCDSLKKINIK